MLLYMKSNKNMVLIFKQEQVLGRWTRLESVGLVGLGWRGRTKPSNGRESNGAERTAPLAIGITGTRNTRNTRNIARRGSRVCTPGLTPARSNAHQV
jgi:hypothetical protein